MALQSAVDSLGFDCKIDNSYTPFVSVGFLPCTLNGQQSGFEIFFEDSAQVLKDFPHLAAQVGDRSTAVTFRWGGDMAECACVLVVSAALAKSFDAIVHYQDDDLVYSDDQLLEEAHTALKITAKKPWWHFW
jgi:hypothetical protein